MLKSNADLFDSAIPVWEINMEKEMNYSLLFRSIVNKEGTTTLRLTGASRYVIKINGDFLAFGPARAAHGFYRVDEFDITDQLTEEENIVSVLVLGYNVNSFSVLDQPSFLCAEISVDGKVTAATGKEGFKAIFYKQRVRKVQRYSFQRPFVEIYSFDEDYNRYETDISYHTRTVLLKPTDKKVFIPRNVYYPEYERIAASEIVESGTVSIHEKDSYYNDRSIGNISPKLKGYRQEQLEVFSSKEAEKLDFTKTSLQKTEPKEIDFSDGYCIYRFERDLSGFIRLDVECKEEITLLITFDEFLDSSRVNFLRLQCCNVLIYRLQAGKYHLQSAEPYTFQYLNCAVTGGKAALSNVEICCFDFPKSKINLKLDLPTDTLGRIYTAAVETFRQNTVDIYMDCPSRERAGWLCDSYFTSRVEYVLTGKSVVEYNFLENFLLPDSFPFLPEGMLPMCYPSDHNDSVFIPNWAMWYVLQLEEYANKRSGDSHLVVAAKERVYRLLDYFRKYENRDGLLESLPGWIFVEWSKANELVQNVNYPTNMLYIRFKKAIALLYGDEKLLSESAELKKVIEKQSFYNGFFCDNAVYGEDGRLHLSGQCTECCQYFAFYFEIATPDTYPTLWKTLVDDFGPDRKQSGKWPQIYFANAFIGNYLRLELLCQFGEREKMISNIEGYFAYMADLTGTLWENDTPYASCNHGFASHVIYWLKKLYQ